MIDPSVTVEFVSKIECDCGTMISLLSEVVKVWCLICGQEWDINWDAADEDEFVQKAKVS